MTTTNKAAVLLLGILALPGGPVAGQEETPDNPLAYAAPELLKMAAPEWIAPGARITWWAGAITIEGTREQIYVLDPRGDYEDNVGNRYRIERKVSLTGGSTEDNVAGHGYCQLDVLAVTEKHAIVSVRLLVMDDVNVPPVLTTSSAAKVDRATGGGMWANPGGLARVQPVDDFMVLRGPWLLDSRVTIPGDFQSTTIWMSLDRVE